MIIFVCLVRLVHTLDYSLAFKHAIEFSFMLLGTLILLLKGELSILDDTVETELLCVVRLSCDDTAFFDPHLEC